MPEISCHCYYWRSHLLFAFTTKNKQQIVNGSRERSDAVKAPLGANIAVDESLVSRRSLMACSWGLLAVFGGVRWQLLAIRFNPLPTIVRYGFSRCQGHRKCRSHWRGTHSQCKRQLSTATTLDEMSTTMPNTGHERSDVARQGASIFIPCRS
ncbi:MAG: hypothetical protein PUP93_25395 [Rhizonema sp. NSF051]|nr:hypothetical protein [Rhizonema sp. NSF051]